MVRRGDDGYRIPTPAEDDWERQRASLVTQAGRHAPAARRGHRGLWQPQPSHTLLDVKPFKAGLSLTGGEVVARATSRST